MTRLIDVKLQDRPIPAPPPNAARRVDGNYVIYDLDDPKHPMRWRYEKGKLITFVVYRRIEEWFGARGRRRKEFGWRALVSYAGPIPGVDEATAVVDKSGLRGGAVS